MAELKNLFNLEAVNQFFENLLEKKVPDMVFDFSGDSNQLQGLEMVQEVGKTAEKEKIVIAADRIFIHECFVVYLEASDYKRLSPLFREIEKDTLEHLRHIQITRNYQTRGPFQIQYMRNEQVNAGRCIVVSSPRKEVARTILNVLELPEETPLQWEETAYAVDRRHDEALSKVFRALDADENEEALAGINRFVQTFPDAVIGRTLQVVLHLLLGQELVALRYLNEEKSLKTIPYGGALKSLCYLMISDINSAEKQLESYFKDHGDDIAFLVKALICDAKGKIKQTDQFLSGAIALNPEMETLVKEIMGDTVISKLRKLPVQNPQLMDKPIKKPKVLRLIHQQTGQAVCLSFDSKLELFFSKKKNRMARKFFQCTTSLPGALPPGSESLLLEIHAGAMKATFGNGNILHLHEEVPVHAGEATWKYRRTKGEELENWKKESKRQFNKICHRLEITIDSMPVEVWYFAEDTALTVGRENNYGNDWVIPESSISGRAHGEFIYEFGTFWFVDLKSSNGTAKNGKRFQEKTSLEYGDLLQLGSASFEVQIGG